MRLFKIFLIRCMKITKSWKETNWILQKIHSLVKSVILLGKNKVGLAKHDKSKHEKNSKNTTTKTPTIQKQDASESDEFTNKINDFLKAMNHLNKPQNDYSCVKCNETFDSKEFLDIHMGATHKVKCKICEFETVHKNLMKEHIEMPGIWHKTKLNSVFRAQVPPNLFWEHLKLLFIFLYFV